MSKTVVRKALWGVLIVALVASATAWATPPFEFISKTIFAIGFIPGGFARYIQGEQKLRR